MPAVGDLDCLWQRLRHRIAITAAAVAQDDRDLGIIGDPRLHGSDLAIGQERHDAPSLRIAYYGSVAMISMRRPIIDADDVQAIGRQIGATPHHPRQRVVANRHRQPSGKAGSRPAAKRQPEMMNETLEP